jgi:hypothetical protein
MPIFTIQSSRLKTTSVENKYVYLGLTFAFGDCNP